MTADDIIDYCLRGIGESDPDSPVNMARAVCLAHINHAYQEIIGPLLNKTATYSYDESDAAHTITNGVATLPTDCLRILRIYDGDPDDGTLLEQITDIEDKVDDDDEMQQYYLPSETQIWFFGQTEDDTVKLYYLQKPTAVTDASASTPSDLKTRFHWSAFTTYIRMVYAREQNENSTHDRMMLLWMDILDDIKRAHTTGRADEEPRVKKAVW